MAPPKKTKKNNRRGMSNGKRSKGKRSKNKRSKSKSNKRSKKRIRNARMVSKKRYTNLLKKKTQKKRMTPKDRKELDRALFVNYCKCIKKIKDSKEFQKGLEYPICMSSVYTKRGIKPHRNATKQCNKYV